MLFISRRQMKEKCFDVRSGDEVIIGKDKIIMTLED